MTSAVAIIPARGGARSVMTVTEADVHPGKSVLLRTGFVEPFTTLEDMERRRQDMAAAYRQSGALYALGVDCICARGWSVEEALLFCDVACSAFSNCTYDAAYLNRF